jgi:hypothetical protein
MKIIAISYAQITALSNERFSVLVKMPQKNGTGEWKMREILFRGKRKASPNCGAKMDGDVDG